MAVSTSGMTWNEVLRIAADAILNGTTVDSGVLADILTALQEEVAYLPPQPILAIADAAYSVLTPGTINLAAVSGDQTLVAAVSGQRTRVHRFCATFTGAAAETLVTFKRGTTAIGYARVPTTGLVIDWAFDSYPHLKTLDNEALIISPAAAVNIAGKYDFLTAAA